MLYIGWKSNSPWDIHLCAVQVDWPTPDEKGRISQDWWVTCPNQLFPWVTLYSHANEYVPHCAWKSYVPRCSFSFSYEGLSFRFKQPWTTLLTSGSGMSSQVCVILVCCCSNHELTIYVLGDSVIIFGPRNMKCWKSDRCSCEAT